MLYNVNPETGGRFSGRAWVICVDKKIHVEHSSSRDGEHWHSGAKPCPGNYCGRPCEEYEPADPVGRDGLVARMIREHLGDDLTPENFGGTYRD